MYITGSTCSATGYCDTCVTVTGWILSQSSLYMSALNAVCNFFLLMQHMHDGGLHSVRTVRHSIVDEYRESHALVHQFHSL